MRSVLQFAVCWLLLGGSTQRAAASVGCHPPSGDWLTGADLAAAVPALRALPAALKASYAPVAGLQRVFHPDELRRLALAQGLPDPGLKENVCFAWPMAPLSMSAIRAAMEAALAGRNARLEIIESSQVAVPAGDLTFSLNGLSGSSTSALVWKGSVRYGDTRQFTIWARVRVTVHTTIFEASETIHTGEALAGRWRSAAFDGPLDRTELLADPATVMNLVARREIPAGTVLRAEFFEAPRAIEKGDTVNVISASGGARIETAASALESGRPGDVILLRNSRSQRTFRARITGPGAADAVPGTSAGLAADESKIGNSRL